MVQPAQYHIVWNIISFIKKKLIIQTLAVTHIPSSSLIQSFSTFLQRTHPSFLKKKYNYYLRNIIFSFFFQSIFLRVVLPTSFRNNDKMKATWYERIIFMHLYLETFGVYKVPSNLL